MREDDDRRRVVGSDLRERLLGPGNHDLVRARQSLTGRELATRVGDDRAPAEALRGSAERLGGVYGAVGQ